MYTNSSGCANHKPSNVNTSTSIGATPFTTTATVAKLIYHSHLYLMQTKPNWQRIHPSLLSKVHITLLVWSANIAVVPLYSPKGGYIPAVEKACLNLPTNIAEGFRSETNIVLNVTATSNPASPGKRPGP